MCMSLISRVVNILDDVGYIRLPRNVFVDGDVSEILALFHEVINPGIDIEVVSLDDAFYMYKDDAVHAHRCLNSIEFYKAVLDERSQELQETIARMRKVYM